MPWIYEIARKKIADALIDGHPLRIEGGDFRICDGQRGNCSFGGCYKQEIYKKYAAEKFSSRAQPRGRIYMWRAWMWKPQLSLRGEIVIGS